MVPPKRPLDDRLRALFAGNRPVAPRDVTAGPSGTTPAAGSLPGLWQGVRSNPVSEMALGMLPGVGQAMDVQDFAAAQREGSPLGMALAAAGAVPVAGDVVKGLAKGGRKVAQAVGALPMDEASRMARAAEQGFEPGYYKGMFPYDWRTGEVVSEIRRPSPFPSFDPNDPPVEGIAGFLTRDPNVANRFAEKTTTQGSVFPLNYRPGKTLTMDAQGAAAGDLQFGPSGQPFRDAVRSGQYDTIVLKNTKDEGDVVVALKPENIRSRFARFDPAQAGSSNLMAGLAGILATGAAATNRREERP